MQKRPLIVQEKNPPVIENKYSNLKANRPLSNKIIFVTEIKFIRSYKIAYFLTPQFHVIRLFRKDNRSNVSLNRKLKQW